MSESAFTARSLFGKLGLLTASLAVALPLAEGLFRLVSGEKVDLGGLYTGGDTVGIALTPIFHGSTQTSEFKYDVAINNLGMRDGPVARKDSQTRRILLIADSFVFGVAVNLKDSLAKVLRRQLLSIAPEQATEVLNAGVPGYSPFQELYTLRRLAPVVSPDFVIQVVFMGDDWSGNGRRQPPEEAHTIFVEQLRIRSALFRFIDRFVLCRLKSRESYEIHRVVPTREFTTRMDDVLSLLRQTCAVAQQYRADFLVALCPRYTQVYEDAWSKAEVIYRLTSGEYSPLEPDHMLSERLQARGFWIVDLLPPLREEGRRHMLNFPVDGHWNREGNAFVASVLAKAIGGRLDARVRAEG